MSWKIHNGWRIARNNRDTLDIIDAIRTTIQTTYRTLYQQHLCAIAVDIIDGVGIDGVGIDGVGIDGAGIYGVEIGSANLTSATPIMRAAFHLDHIHRHTKQTRRRNAHDLAFDIVLLHNPNDRTHIYALTYTEQPAYTTALADCATIEHWPWWNNTDRPDNIDIETWETRGNTWQMVLGDQTEPPATRGVTWTLLGDYGHDCTLWTNVNPEIVEHIPTRKGLWTVVVQVPSCVTDDAVWRIQRI